MAESKAKTRLRWLRKRISRLTGLRYFFGRRKKKVDGPKEEESTSLPPRPAAAPGAPSTLPRPPTKQESKKKAVGEEVKRPEEKKRLIADEAAIVVEDVRQEAVPTPEEASLVPQGEPVVEKADEEPSTLGPPPPKAEAEAKAEASVMSQAAAPPPPAAVVEEEAVVHRVDVEAAMEKKRPLKKKKKASSEFQAPSSEFSQAPSEFSQAPSFQLLKKKPKAELQVPVVSEEEAVALVVDAGACRTRAGLAGESAEPSFDGASVVGRKRGTLGGAEVPEVAFGDDAERAAAVYELVEPVARGVAAHWDECEKLWKAAFVAVAEATGVTPTRVVLACGVLVAKATKARLAQLCFEALGFDACHLGVAPVLALFGAGYTTGLVVDCGKDSARAVPVFDGFALPHAIMIDPCLGGDALDAHAARVLETKGLAFKNARAAAVAGRAVKIQAASVAKENNHDDEDPRDDVVVDVPARTLASSTRRSRADQLDAKTGDLSVTLSSTELRAIGETLFRPQIANTAVESPGLHGAVAKAIAKCDIDIRRSMYEGVLLVGGGSMVPNTPERLDRELKHLSPPNAPVAVTAYDNRHLAAYAGAAYVAGLDDFKDNWIYHEDADDPLTLEARINQTAYGC